MIVVFITLTVVLQTMIIPIMMRRLMMMKIVYDDADADNDGVGHPPRLRKG